MKRLRPALWFAIRFLIAVALCVLLIRTVDVPVLVEQLREANWLWLGLSVLSQIAGIFVSTIRWEIVLDILGIRRPFAELLLRYWNGSFFNAVLPGIVGGDVIRVGGLVRSGVPLAPSMLSVFADRAVGLWVNMLLGFLCSLWPSRLPHRAPLGLMFGAIVGAGIVSVWLAPALRRSVPERLQGYVTLAGLLHHPGRWRVLGLAALFQICVVLHAYTIARALHLSIGVVVWGRNIPAVVLATLLPISLNGIGIRETTLVFLLAGTGTPPETAVLVGVLLYAVTVVSSLPGGLMGLVSPAPARSSP